MTDKTQERYSVVLAIRLREREAEALREDADFRRASVTELLRQLVQREYGLPQDAVWSREQAQAMFHEETRS